jgi:hypothetical protein
MIPSPVTLSGPAARWSSGGLGGLGPKLKRDYAPSSELCNERHSPISATQRTPNDHALDLIGAFNDLEGF